MKSEASRLSDAPVYTPEEFKTQLGRSASVANLAILESAQYKPKAIAYIYMNLTEPNPARNFMNLIPDTLSGSEPFPLPGHIPQVCRLSRSRPFGDLPDEPFESPAGPISGAQRFSAWRSTARV